MVLFILLLAAAAVCFAISQQRENKQRAEQTQRDISAAAKLRRLPFYSTLLANDLRQTLLTRLGFQVAVSVHGTSVEVDFTPLHPVIHLKKL